jgi:DNA-binding response OmpR family regulator
VREIMIADDDRVFSAALQSRFRERGYRVSSVLNGVDLLSQLETRSPDLLLLDVVMPGLSGIQVLERMEENPGLRSIPVVVVSSRSDSATRARCLELGAWSFYAKPLSLRQLAADVEAQFADQW